MTDRTTPRAAPPTMRDVGALAGVSTMTVSRVLRGDRGVTKQTRARVLRAVDELGYRRNELARSLRIGQRTGMVGLVVTNLANPFYSRMALSVESVAAECGLRMVIGNTAEDQQAEHELVADLLARRVDGLIVVPAGGDHTYLAAAEQSGVPVVFASRPPEGMTADCVLVDDFGGARDATARLLAAGHRRIGFVGNPPAVYTGAERFRGYCVAMAEAGVEVDERYVRRGQRDVAAAKAVTAELLAMADPPTALFCSNNRNTIGAFRAISTAGASVALAGFDDFELADTLGVPLIVVDYDVDELGRWAGQQLLNRIGCCDKPADNGPPRRYVLPTKLIEHGGRPASN